MKSLFKKIVATALIFLIPLAILSLSGCDLGKDDDTLVITIHEDSENKDEAVNGDIVGDAGKSFTLLIWEEFVPNEMIEEFEKKFGIRPKVEVMEEDVDLTELLEKTPGRYDLIIASEYDLEGLLEEELLAEIDRGNIPNMTNIAAKFSQVPWDTGMKYSVPFTWGTIAILYNKNEVPENSISWETLRDPAYTGKIDLPNEPEYIFTQGKKILGLSVNESNPEKLEEVKELLFEQKEIIRGYFSIEEIKQHLVDGSSFVAFLPSYIALEIIEENEHIDFKVPNNGAPLWVDSWIIPESAKNKKNAEIFVNFMLNKENVIEFAEYGLEPVTVIGIRDQLDDELLKLGDIFPTNDVLKKCEHYEFSDEKSWDFMYKAWIELDGKDELKDED